MLHRSWSEILKKVIILPQSGSNYKSLLSFTSVEPLRAWPLNRIDLFQIYKIRKTYWLDYKYSIIRMKINTTYLNIESAAAGNQNYEVSVKLAISEIKFLTPQSSTRSGRSSPSSTLQQLIKPYWYVILIQIKHNMEPCLADIEW